MGQSQSRSRQRSDLWERKKKDILAETPILDMDKLEECTQRFRNSLKQQKAQNEMARQENQQFTNDSEVARSRGEGLKNKLQTAETVFVFLLFAVIIFGSWVTKIKVDDGAFVSWHKFLKTDLTLRRSTAAFKDVYDLSTCTIDNEYKEQVCQLDESWKQKYFILTPSNLQMIGVPETQAVQIWDSLQGERSYTDILLALYQFFMPKLTMKLVLAWLGLCLGLFFAGLYFSFQEAQTFFIILFYLLGRFYWGSDDYLVKIPGGFFSFWCVCLFGRSSFRFLQRKFPNTQSMLASARVMSYLLTMAGSLLMLLGVPFGPIVLIFVVMALALYAEACFTLIAAAGLNGDQSSSLLALFVVGFGTLFTYLATKLDLAASLDAIYGVDDEQELPEILKIPMAIHFAGASLIWCGLTFLFAGPCRSQTDEVKTFVYLALQAILVLLGLNLQRSVLIFFGVLGILYFELSIFQMKMQPLHLCCSFLLMGLSSLIREEAYVMFGVLESIGGIIMGPLGVLGFSLAAIHKGTANIFHLLAQLALCCLSVIQQREAALCVGLFGVIVHVFMVISIAKDSNNVKDVVVTLTIVGYALIIFGVFIDGI